jgi:hypothetical protein
MLEMVVGQWQAVECMKVRPGYINTDAVASKQKVRSRAGIIKSRKLCCFCCLFRPAALIHPSVISSFVSSTHCPLFTIGPPCHAMHGLCGAALSPFQMWPLATPSFHAALVIIKKTKQVPCCALPALPSLF